MSADLGYSTAKFLQGLVVLKRCEQGMLHYDAIANFEVASWIHLPRRERLPEVMAKSVLFSFRSVERKTSGIHRIQKVAKMELSDIVVCFSMSKVLVIGLEREEN